MELTQQMTPLAPTAENSNANSYYARLQGAGSLAAPPMTANRRYTIQVAAAAVRLRFSATKGTAATATDFYLPAGASFSWKAMKDSAYLEVIGDAGAAEVFIYCSGH